MENDEQELPKSFIEEGLEIAKGVKIFNRSLFDMTRDELIASAAQGWSAERKQREEYDATAPARAAFFVQQATVNGG